MRLGKGNYVYSSVVLSDPVSITRARTRLPNTTRERITHIDSDCQLTPA